MVLGLWLEYGTAKNRHIGQMAHLCLWLTRKRLGLRAVKMKQ
jgi:hypothetical protein